jgi:predicted kinase
LAASGRPRRRPGPRLVVLAGLPGTGKSTLARHLAEATGALWLRVDRIEAALLTAGLPRRFETGLAAYVVARDLALDHLRLGHSVVVDAVNGVPEARAMWRDAAEACGVERRIVELVCSDPAEHRRRVESRRPPTPPLPAPTWEEVVRREYAAWDEPVLRIDTLRPVDECVVSIVEHLARPMRDASPPAVRPGLGRGRRQPPVGRRRPSLPANP